MSNKYKQYAEKIIKMTPEELKQEDKRLRDKLGMNQKELPPWLFRQISDNAFAFSESLRTAEEKMWAQAHFTIGAKSLVAQLVEAQERIRELERVLENIVTVTKKSDYLAANRIAKEALSPNNKQKEDE